MKTNPVSHIAGGLIAGLLLISQPAFAQSAAYSTDGEEVEIATLRNDKCCNTIALQQDANVRLNVQHISNSIIPMKVEVIDEDNHQVALFSTRDKVIYMRLPAGRYTINVNALTKKKSFEVDTSDDVLKSYAI